MEDDYFESLTPQLKVMYLKQRQALPLSVKIELSNRRIKEWYESHNGNVYVSFSGGKDSTVLLHLVRSIYPDVPAVFVDTGLEYPEIRDFVKTFDNVVWVKPKKTFKEVIENYGYPVVSKEIAMTISRIRNTKSELQKELRINGGVHPVTGATWPKLPKKYRYLLDAPFKISDACCDHLKKNPLKKYDKISGRKPYIGIMAGDSWKRRQMFIKHGCNAYNQSSPQSRPMIFWLEADVWNYIREHNIPYCPIYDSGVDRTGCIYCAFGIMQEKNNRFVLLEKSHPDIHDYCINKLGLGKVLDYIDVPYTT